MPVHNKRKSLKQLTMIVIAKNFEYVCYDVRNRKEKCYLIEHETYRTMTNRFECLPIAVRQELQAVVCSVCGYLRRHHMHALLHEYQNEFKFSEAGDIYSAAEFLVTKCSKLKKLNMNYVRDVSPSTIINMLPHMRNLTHLSLVRSRISDQVLDEVGKHCPVLQCLDVSQTSITKKGLLRLCYDEEYHRVRCPKLWKLTMTGCHVSADAVWVLLSKIPTIRELEYENTFQALRFGMTMLYQQSLRANFPTQLSLAYLTAGTSEVITEADMEFSIDLCPYLTSITFDSCKIENDALYKTMNCDHLRHLRITNDIKFTLDFYEGLMPLLTYKGTQIKSLILTRFPEIDLLVIGAACPNLEKLALSEITQYGVQLSPNKTLFTKLTAVEIWSMVPKTVSCGMLKQLLCFAPNIHNLLLSRCIHLNDHLFNEILSVNPLKQLERLTLESCFGVSRHVVETLLDMNNNLAFLRVWSCIRIQKKDERILANKIQQNDLDMFFEWFP